MPGDRVKVLDFGLSCVVGTEDIDLSGTVAYISPEQIEGNPVDERTDIYGLGAVAYEMVTGAKPFRAETVKGLLDLHLNQDIPDPADLVPDLPDELRRFIMKAGRSNPDRRYQNVAQVLEEIRPLAMRIRSDGSRFSRKAEDDEHCPDVQGRGSTGPHPADGGVQRQGRGDRSRAQGLGSS